jgi:hypothetical protein
VLVAQLPLHLEIHREILAKIQYLVQLLLLAVGGVVAVEQLVLDLLAALAVAVLELTPVLLAILRQLHQAKEIMVEQAQIVILLVREAVLVLLAAMETPRSEEQGVLVLHLQ